MSPQPMASAQIVKPVAQPELENRAKGVRTGSRWVRIILVVMGLSAAGSGAAYFLAYMKGQDNKDVEKRHAKGGSESATGKPRVQVVTPERGGMERTTNQPGTVRAFEYAELFAKVSGFVKTLNVDRGSRVKKGDLLAEIYDPERDVAVEQAAAALEHAHAEVAQAQSSILTAQASVLAAKAQQNEAKAVLKQRNAERDYRKKQYIRFTELVRKGDIEERVADEQHDNYLSAEGAVDSAQAGIETAAAGFAEASAAVEKARADLKAAEAKVKVSEANLDMAKVFVQYTKILAPYEGVVTSRGDSVHPGTFIRSASEGMSVPMLTVARDDKMRTIVLVPDRDVPYCQVGDPATVQLDALAGRVFKARVSRIAESEDLKDRTMRIEIDIENPDRALRDGMFGRAEILLEKLIKNLSIPSSCLVQRNGKGEGAVFVVKDGELHRVPIRVGLDNGLRVEVTSGLNETDQVVLRPDASVPEGTKVQADAVKSPSAIGNE
jgi:HlyD family secretion protein